MATSVLDSYWSAQDTTPSAIEEALRQLVSERHRENEGYVAARALNLVTIVDAEYSGEIANRLRRVGRNPASRTGVCSVEPGRTTIDARATVASEADPRPGEFSLMRETVVVSVGEQHLAHLDRIVDPLVVTDLATVVWSPHGHPEAVDALLPLAQVVLLDSVADDEARAALERAGQLAQEAYVVDLAWLRSTPWRERVAATFDPPKLRLDLGVISKVEIRHHPDSGAAALLLVGWMAARLGWQPGRLTATGGGLAGSARARRQDIQLRLEVAPEQPVLGLAGLALETASGRR